MKEEILAFMWTKKGGKDPKDYLCLLIIVNQII